MGVSCGSCNKIISDVGTCNMGVLFTDPDNIEDTWKKCISVYECGDCGSLTMLWKTWEDKEHRKIYTPTSGKNNDLMSIRQDEYQVEG